MHKRDEGFVCASWACCSGTLFTNLLGTISSRPYSNANWAKIRWYLISRFSQQRATSSASANEPLVPFVHAKKSCCDVTRMHYRRYRPPHSRGPPLPGPGIGVRVRVRVRVRRTQGMADRNPTDSDERGVMDWLGDTLAGDCTVVWPGQKRYR